MANRGDPVEVRTRFRGAWAKGFEVVETIAPQQQQQPPRYRVRRTADGRVLPAEFDANDIRPLDGRG